MYKVVFAEDEATTRNNICRVIDWEKYNFQIVSMSSDGEEALAAIEQYHPDVLITDIKMPFIDGLELSKMAKSLLPTIRIVILSGYSEFVYAQEAIKIGVQDYLIKPITPTRLIQILVKLHDQLEEDAKNRKRHLQIIDDLRYAELRLQKLPEGNLSADDLSGIHNVAKQLDDFLRLGSRENIDTFVDTLFDSFNERSIESSLFRYYFLLKILSACIKAVEDMNGDPREVLPFTNDISAFLHQTVHIKTARKMIYDCLLLVIEFRKLSMNGTASLAERAKLYIESNFSSPELSAKQVAEYVNLSPNYFSNVFKQFTGVSFVKYVIKYRICKAKVLLKTTDLSISDIAEKVGFSNPNYFYMVFHRSENCTPHTYRET